MAKPWSFFKYWHQQNVAFSSVNLGVAHLRERESCSVFILCTKRNFDLVIYAVYDPEPKDCFLTYKSQRDESHLQEASCNSFPLNTVILARHWKVVLWMWLETAQPDMPLWKEIQHAIMAYLDFAIVLCCLQSWGWQMLCSPGCKGLPTARSPVVQWEFKSSTQAGLAHPAKCQWPKSVCVDTSGNVAEQDYSSKSIYLRWAAFSFHPWNICEWPFSLPSRSLATAGLLPSSESKTVFPDGPSCVCTVPFLLTQHSSSSHRKRCLPGA